MSKPDSEDPMLQDAECGDEKTQLDKEEFINYIKKRKLENGDICNMINIGKLPKDMSKPESEDPMLQDAECGDEKTQLDKEEFINYIKKRKLENGDICNMINIGKLPKDEHKLKVMVELERLSQSIDKKIEKIQKRYSTLEKNIHELKTLVEKKTNKTEQAIKIFKENTFTKIGEDLEKCRSVEEKASIIKSAIAEESRKIEMDKDQLKNEKDKCNKEMENILAMYQERFDKTHGEMLEKDKEQSRLIRKLKKNNEKETQEKERIDKIIQKLKNDINTIIRKKKDMEKNHYEMQCKMAKEKQNIENNIETLRKKLDTERIESQNNIRDLKQQERELKRKIEAERNEMKSNETLVKQNITKLQDTLHSNKDQNEKLIELMRIEFATSKEKYENNIQIIQQFKSEIQRLIEAEIHNMQETETQLKIKMGQKIEALQNILAEKK